MIEYFPPIQSLRANAQHIRSLAIISDIPPGKESNEYFNIQGCTQLQQFIWDPRRDDVDLRGLINFLKKNGSKIKNLDLQFHRHKDMSQFWKLLVQGLHSTLQSLKINFNIVNHGDAPWIFMACRGLIELEVECNFLSKDLIPFFQYPFTRNELLQEAMEKEGSQTKSLLTDSPARGNLDSRDNAYDEHMFPHIRKLKIPRCVDNKGSWLTMMKECPKLETFYFSDNEEIVIVHDECEAIASASTWPNLNSMEIWSTLITDESTADLILSLNRNRDQVQSQVPSDEPKRLLENFINISTNTGMASFYALQSHGHFETLESLSIFSRAFGSMAILTVLTSCPRLKVIVAVKIHAADIAEARSRPWACLGLVSWEISIEADLRQWTPSVEYEQLIDRKPPTESEMQDATLEQLGRLCHLQTLGLGWWTYNDPTVGISLTVDKGLERLSGLWQLEELTFSGWGLKEKDVDWIAVHWKHLKRVNFVDGGLSLRNKDKLTWEIWQKRPL
ncbi:hypothetical protein BGX27_006307 [Mortierella sp. AM989]|nr:hypothetical protein BGX27_006307 [Mortierella sp. AM989]